MSEPQGWVKLWRKWQEHEMSRDPNATLVFMHLLTRASREPRPNRRYGYTLSPGQCDETQEQLSQASGLSRDAVRGAMTRLLRYGTIKITQHSTLRRNIITLVNWDRYSGEDSKVPNDRPNNSPTTPQETPDPREVREVKKTTTTLPEQAPVSRQKRTTKARPPHWSEPKGSQLAVLEGCPPRGPWSYLNKLAQDHTKLAVLGALSRAPEFTNWGHVTGWLRIAAEAEQKNAKPTPTYDFVDGVQQ